MKINFAKMSLLAALVAVSGLVPEALAQVVPTTITSLTNVPATLATNTTSTTTNILALGKNSALALQVPVISASGNTATFGVSGSFSVDGTNFGTAPFWLTGAANGTTLVVLTTNWNQFQLAGYTAVNFTTWTNGATASITNRGILANRVNYNQ